MRTGFLKFLNEISEVKEIVDDEEANIVYKGHDCLAIYNKYPFCAPTVRIYPQSSLSDIGRGAGVAVDIPIEK